MSGSLSRTVCLCVGICVARGGRVHEYSSAVLLTSLLFSLPIEHIAAHSSAELSRQTHNKCLRVCASVPCVCLCKGERKETISYLTTFTLKVVTLNKKQNWPLQKKDCGMAE